MRVNSVCAHDEAQHVRQEPSSGAFSFQGPAWVRAEQEGARMKLLRPVVVTDSTPAA